MKASIINRGYHLVVAFILTMLLATPTVLPEVVNTELPEQYSIALTTPNGDCQNDSCGS